MRLVDADKARECFGGDGVTGAVMQRMFDSLPTIDAVPVVRCRECRYWSEDGRCDPPQNGLIREYTRPDDFCSYGEEADHDKHPSDPV